MYSIIAAISNNNAIGVEGNKLPWSLPKDLAMFKALTAGGTIIMGRKTFDSFNGRILPHRDHIVISRTLKKGMKQSGSYRVCSDLDSALQHALTESFNPIFIIGGASIYKEGLREAKKLYLTRVDTVVENATAFFPEVDLSEWHAVSKIPFPADEKHQFPFTLETYVRKLV